MWKHVIFYNNCQPAQASAQPFESTNSSNPIPVHSPMIHSHETNNKENNTYVNIHNMHNARVTPHHPRPHYHPRRRNLETRPSYVGVVPPLLRSIKRIDSLRFILANQGIVHSHRCKPTWVARGGVPCSRSRHCRLVYLPIGE